MFAGSERERLTFGTPVLPRLSKHSADRNRTSPFAFTGNKFEFRALGASQSAGLANTVLNTIVADAIDELTRAVLARQAAGEELEPAVRAVVADAYRAHRRIVFDGDGYSAAWEREARERGLLNLRTTPDALGELIAESSVRVFAEQSVLSARELQARHDVLLEQYATKLTIEAETAAQMARTLLAPAALRHRRLIETSGGPLGPELLDELDGPLRDLRTATVELEAVVAAAPADAAHLRDRALPAMAAVRDAADRLERIVADDLWPLPTYAEMLFIR
jgi:glutamine synthetase